MGSLAPAATSKVRTTRISQQQHRGVGLPSFMAEEVGVFR